MNRQEAVEFLFKELEKVPNRDVCRVATESQLERIAAEIDFETMEILLAEIDLCLRISQIPAELRTESILYFEMLTEYVEPHIVEDEVWDRHDEETADFLTSVKEIFQIYEWKDVLNISVAEFLKYAKSDKPDF